MRSANRHARQRGQATLEMAGVVVVIAAIFAALIGSGMAARIGQTLASSIESIVGGGASSSHSLHWGAPARGSTSTLPGSASGAPGSASGAPGSASGAAPGATSTPPGATSTTAPSTSVPPANLRVAPLTQENELKPWTRIGLSESQWDQVQNEILSKVNPGGLAGFLFGAKYAAITLDKNGHLTLIPIEQDGLGEGLGELLEDLGGWGKALASGAASALADAVSSLPGPILAKLAEYGIVDASTESSEAFATATDQAFFWSGRTEGVGGADIASELASGKGGTTIESLAVVGKSLRPGSVCENVELPALEDNPNVTRIIKIDPQTHAETVIYP